MPLGPENKTCSVKIGTKGREAHLERKGAGVPASEGERCIKAVEK